MKKILPCKYLIVALVFFAVVGGWSWILLEFLDLPTAMIVNFVIGVFAGARVLKFLERL